VFPTEELEANVRGRVQGGPSEVVVEGGPGISLHTRTDAEGRFALYLDPGKYSIQARSLRGPMLSRPAVVEVMDDASIELDDLALGVDSDRAPMTDPAVVIPASDLPTIERDLERATPTSTPQAGPRTLDPGVRAPTPTATPERPGVRLPGSR
jgi:hypothetical protein